MLSILIPVRNEYENLSKIESIFQQNLKNTSYEVLLVNDFSTDQTLSRGKEIVSQNNNFRICI